jgi:uncharacterized integral membrane protein (TIGR00698 family)
VRVGRIVVPIVAGATLAPIVSAPIALLAGIALGLTLGDPFVGRTRKIQQKLLAGSVIGLGAGMDLGVVGRVGLHGLGYTAVGITVAFVLGTILARVLGVARDVALLITVGTAICGGSAIAAVAPVIAAEDRDISVALVSVFLLNAIALFIFPMIGHALAMPEPAFGLWSALAIHDTSSVVGAAGKYGPQALEIATAAKLARALWIVPVTFSIAFLRARAHRTEANATDAPRPSPKKPWFIAGFVAVAALVTYVPALRPAGEWVAWGAKRSLALTLFLIGLGLSRKALKAIGARPLILAVSLWIALAAASLGAIVSGAIG